MLTTAKVPDYDRIRNYTGWVDPAAQPRRATYAYRLRGDRLSYEFCLLGAGNEPVSVESIMRDGRHVKWEGRIEGDMQVFHPPDGQDIDDGIFLAYDRRMLRVEAMDRHEIERFAMRYRIAVAVP
jgi:hypothetical protein